MSLGDFMEGFLPAKESAERGWTHREKMNELQRERRKRDAIAQAGRDSMVETAIPTDELTDQSKMLAEQTADLDLGEMQEAEEALQQNVMETVSQRDWDKYSKGLAEVFAEYGDVEGLSRATALTNELRRNDTKQLLGAAQAAMYTGNLDRAAELIRNADNYALSGFGQDIKVEGGKLLVGGEPINEEDLQNVIGMVDDPTAWYQWQKEFRDREQRTEIAQTASDREGEKHEVWKDLQPLERRAKEAQVGKAEFEVGILPEQWEMDKEKHAANIAKTEAEAQKALAGAKGKDLTPAEIRQRTQAVGRYVGDRQKAIQSAVSDSALMRDPKRRQEMLDATGVRPQAIPLYQQGMGDEINSLVTRLLRLRGSEFDLGGTVQEVEDNLLQGNVLQVNRNTGETRWAPGN